jgi:cell division septation protein DedD
MWFRRRRVGVLVVLAAALTLAPVPPQAAGESLDACAQRVIRDWYSGGRVDGVYPLGCYRAALRALPDDVLQYSNADQDIRRALAFARRGLEDPGNERPTEAPEQSATGPGTSRAAQPERAAQAPTQAPRPAPVAHEASSPPREARVVAERPAPTSSIPYPILALGALAALLLTAGAAGWVASRRR